MIPTMRIGGTMVLTTTAVVVAVFGAAHLLATVYPDSRFTEIWVGALGF